MRETRVRRIGRATIGSAIVFGASLTLWLSQCLMPPPGEAAQDLDAERAALLAALDAATGPVVLVSNEIGQGVMPAGYHPLADQLSSRELAEFMTLSQRHVDQVVGRLPDHAAFIAAHCAADQRVAA